MIGPRGHPSYTGFTRKVMAVIREIRFDLRSEMDLEGKTEITALKIIMFTLPPFLIGNSSRLKTKSIVHINAGTFK